jgi:hypothetical protein
VGNVHRALSSGKRASVTFNGHTHRGLPGGGCDSICHIVKLVLTSMDTVNFVLSLVMSAFLYTFNLTPASAAPIKTYFAAMWINGLSPTTL